MALKVQSVNFIKAADLPQRVVNTEMAQVVATLGEQIKKGIPAGQAIAVRLAGSKKWTRYALQKKLRKAGHDVSLREKDGIFYIQNAPKEK